MFSFMSRGKGADVNDVNRTEYQNSPTRSYEQYQTQESPQSNEEESIDDESNEYYSNIMKLVPSNSELTNIVTYFSELRKESSFLDITFTCRGILIKAHKIIVSSWSRWLKSLLLEEVNDDYFTLDIFHPNAFHAVIDYMYGIPLAITLDKIDQIMQVVRRLEMIGLEQQIWKYLISIIDDTNCSVLHDIADKYDCPPLKLAAFRIIQENDPAYSLAPIIWDASRARENYHDSMNKVESGLTGPGEASYYMNVTNSANYTNQQPYNDYEDDEDEHISILNPKSNMNSSVHHEGRTHDGGDEDDRDDDEDYDEDYDEEAYSHRSEVMFPENLPSTAPAAQVVKAWAARLQYVYQQCQQSTSKRVPAVAASKFFNKRDVKSSTATNVADDSDFIDQHHPHRPATSPKYGPPLNKSNVKTGRVDWKQELKRFYLTIKMPDKLDKIDGILQAWEGKEDQVLPALVLKYKKLIPPALMDHIEDVQASLETQTESSFVMQNGRLSPVRARSNVI